MAGALITTNILQTGVAMGLKTLRENLVMAKLVNHDYEEDVVGAKKGATVQVSVPARVQTRAVAPDVVPPAVTAYTPESVPITLSEWQEAPFAIDDKGIAQMRDGIQPMQANEAIYALCRDIDNHIFGEYKQFYGYAGTAGTTPFASDLETYLLARATAHNQLMTPDSRYVVIDEWAEAKALNLRAFQDASYRGDTGGITKGMIGEKIGAMWLMSQNVPTHDNTGGSGFLINKSNVAVGDTDVAVDTGSTAPAEGDIFTVAGDTQTYVIKALPAPSATAWTFAPEARVAWANNAAVTFKADHVVNLLLQKNAIAFAMAPLAQQPKIDGSMVAVAIDDKTGLSLRLEVTRQHKQIQWSYDALWGTAVIRPEYGVRIAG